MNKASKLKQNAAAKNTKEVDAEHNAWKLNWMRVGSISKLGVSAAGLISKWGTGEKCAAATNHWGKR